MRIPTGRAGWLTVLVVAAAGCGGGSTPSDPMAAVPPPSFAVDPSVVPLAPTVAGLEPGDPPRPVAAAQDALGNRVEFIADEMLVVAATRAAADAVAARWGGTVVTESPLGVLAPGATGTLFMIRVDATPARPQELPRWTRQLDPASRGAHAVSSLAGLRLLAAIGEEVAVHGVAASANPLLTGASIATRSVTEAATALGGGDWTYAANAFDWTQLRRGGSQDLGVAEAWRMLADAGKLGNRVWVMVLDGGFSANADLATAHIYPAWGWEHPNPATCTGGTPCAWHGTGVAQIAGGLVDNHYGAAGSGGPVVDLLLVPSMGGDFLSYVVYAIRGINAAIFNAPDIINMSGGARIPAGLYALTFGALDVVTGSVTAAGTVIVAAAGNEGQNVDAEDCLIPHVCWEEAVWAPCELWGVVCVGGLGLDSADAASDSNYGVHTDATVDIYGPFWNWIGPDPAAPGSGNVARLISGTSGAAPFVAGVIALAKAADPSRSANEARDLVLATAHRGSGRARSWVNAYAAVRAALGNNAPPYLEITAPTSGWGFPRGSALVSLTALVEDDDGDPLTVTWTSDRDGVIASGPSGSTRALSVGVHVLTATVTDGQFPVSRSVNVTITNTAPTVTIVQPAGAASIYVGETLSLGGTSFDPNDQAALPDAAVSWRLGSATAAPFATGHLASVSFATTGTRVVYFVGTDGSLTGTASFAVTVLPAPTNYPPTPTITAPAGPAYDAGYPTTSDAGGYYALVSFTGQATDPEDGVLSGTALRWFSKVQGAVSDVEFGTGPAVSRKLYVQAGAATTTHLVRLQATDATGNARSVSLSVVVRQLL
jgi:serine protease